MQAELATIAAACGLTCLKLDRACGQSATNLARVVLTLLLEQGPEARALVQKHELHASFPIALMAGIPVWDRTRHHDEHERRPAIATVARNVAGFFTEIARQRPLVLVVDQTALSDPLAAAVIALLQRTISRRSAVQTRTRGFVLALPETDCNGYL
jgi:hypothetical protein